MLRLRTLVSIKMIMTLDIKELSVIARFLQDFSSEIEALGGTRALRN